MKFLLAVPNHIEPRVNAPRERDLSKISYDVLYGVLKIHELELIQKRATQANQGNMVNTLCALIVNESIKSLEAVTSQLRIEEVCEEEATEDEEAREDEDVEDEFYTLEELDGLKNTSYAFMARKFPNLRFKKS